MHIKIYQINSERDANRILFLSFEAMQRYSQAETADPSIYDKVFDGSVGCDTLEDVYTMFNIDRPQGYKGRSMSVSDVVEIVDSNNAPYEDEGFYYCDSIGFRKIDFSPEKSLDEIIAECDNKKQQAGNEMSNERRLPDGWTWIDYEDGSGGLKSPDGKWYFSYDLCTSYAALGEIEYKRTDKTQWTTFFGNLAEFKKIAEESISKEFCRPAEQRQNDVDER